jgi:hypothetical protein
MRSMMSEVLATAAAIWVFCVAWGTATGSMERVSGFVLAAVIFLQAIFFKLDGK